MNIVHQVLSYVKKQIFHPASCPRPTQAKLTLFEALDRSLAFGYASVNWGEVR